MKITIKYLFLFIILTAVFSILGGCTTTTKTELPRGDYPPAPAAIMQAELKKLDGTNFKIEDYKGKVVLINLWATWCGPCRDEMPELVKLQNQYREKGFEIVGLNLDEAEDAAMITAFADEMGLNYQLAKGEEKLGKEFLRVSKVDAIPQSFLIDREGRLVGVFVGGGEKTVEKLKENVKRVVG